MNKEKVRQVKTIQINYPAPYFHHSWSLDPEQKKKRVPRKLVSPYKSRNEVFTAGQGHICPNNPILTLERAAKKLESITKKAFPPRPKLERKKSPKKRDANNKNIILIKESNIPKPRKKSPRASSPHLKYGMFKKPPRMRGQTYVHMEKRRRIGIIPSSVNSPVMLYRASPMPSLAISEIVHLDIKPRQPSPHRGQGAAFSWRGVTKAS
ncbi:uncharacterized protein [Choristoneura fumiferana]|uniref:uncharacterized protein n=1 Tax=Choristoneura fumiferana TaxID=7141 RepID=UPI003D15AF3F